MRGVNFDYLLCGRSLVSIDTIKSVKSIQSIEPAESSDSIEFSMESRQSAKPIECMSLLLSADKIHSLLKFYG